MAVLLSSQHQVQFCDTILGRIAAEVRGNIMRKKRMNFKLLICILPYLISFINVAMYCNVKSKNSCSFSIIRGHFRAKKNPGNSRDFPGPLLKFPFPGNCKMGGKLETLIKMYFIKFNVPPPPRGWIFM